MAASTDGDHDGTKFCLPPEEFNVALRDMAALQERIKLLQEEIAGRVAESSSRTLFVLTVVTVLALLINIIATFTAIAAWLSFRKPRD